LVRGLRVGRISVCRGRCRGWRVGRGVGLVGYLAGTLRASSGLSGGGRGRRLRGLLWIDCEVVMLGFCRESRPVGRSVRWLVGIHGEAQCFSTQQ
jgi:hypothetical protein